MKIIKKYYLQPKFKSQTEDLHGAIYDVGVNNQLELFTKTTNLISSYTGITFKEA